MWQQTYQPLLGSAGWSAAAAALPIIVPLALIGLLRRPAWVAGLAGLATALLVATGIYGMPAGLAARAAALGAAFSLLPIAWIVYWAVVLYRLTAATGDFAVIKDSISGVTTDRRLQAILIAFAFGAFIEGAAGFGTPVAVAAAMLTGLGFAPLTAAGICLLANTAPVAFGSIGVPIVTLAGTTGLPELVLSGWVGRLCAPVSLLIPSYLVLVLAGYRGLRGVLPATLVCGGCFASVQFLVSTRVGPQLVDILGAVAAMAGLVVLLRFWQPRDAFVMGGDFRPVAAPAVHGPGRTVRAWSPYLFLVLFVLVWGLPQTRSVLEATTIVFDWPGLHDLIGRTAPAVAVPAPYAARFTFNWLAAAGTACALATLAGALVLRASPALYCGILGSTARQLAVPVLTMACVLGLAYVMNYSGAVVTLGQAFAGTGRAYPFFSALLGWLGVFLTGSDTSANALFGNLQVVAATSLGLDPALMAASNSAGGVMGKMISLTSIAVAVAATGLARSDEARLFRFTVKHSVLLAALLGVLATIFAYTA